MSGQKDEGLSAADVVEAELAERDQAAVFEENNTAAEEEGPEPARIPTSLTAQLQERGHRYPHRVSRRMRRKMRGPQTGEEAGKPPAEGKPEERTVAAPREERRESRPQEARGPGSARSANAPAAVHLRPLKEAEDRVQIRQRPLGQERRTHPSHIALPGRFVVYMPTLGIGIPQIPSDEERQRLKRILQTHREGVSGSFICRTAAENKSEEEETKAICTCSTTFGWICVRRR